MVEINLIKLLLNKESYEQAIQQGLVLQDFPKELQPLYSVISNFHGLNNCNLSVADLANLVHSLNGSNKDKQFYDGVLSNLETLDVSEGTSKTLLTSLLQKRKLKELSLAAYEAYEGKLELEKFLPLLESFQVIETVDEEEDEFVSDNIAELVNKAVNTPGLEWRLKIMRQMLGPLRKGNAGFVFARPETGKTTLLASEVSYMGEQAENPILIFANEDEGDVYKLRVIQATFGITLEQLLSDLDGWQQKYDKVMQGRIKLKAAGSISAKEIERLCAKHNPSLIVVDQLAHVSGFADDKKNLQLGKAYRWFRELAKEYAPGIAVHQAGGEGEGVMWLTMNHVDEVKTAAQAHTDWILGVGKQNKDGYENIRYLHLSKNKLFGGPETQPGLRHGKREVLIRPEIARYEDLY